MTNPCIKTGATVAYQDRPNDIGYCDVFNFEDVLIFNRIVCETLFEYRRSEFVIVDTNRTMVLPSGGDSRTTIITPKNNVIIPDNPGIITMWKKWYGETILQGWYNEKQ